MISVMRSRLICRSIARVLVLAFALSAGMSGAGLISDGAAQEDPEAESVAESRAASFQTVSGPTQESMPGGPLLLGAYGAFIVMLLGYVAYLARLQTTSARELVRLGAVLDAQAASESASQSSALEQ